MVIPVGRQVAGEGAHARRLGRAAWATSSSRHGRQWVELDGEQGEEEAEEEVRAELEAEAEERRQADFASWLPKPGSIRAAIIEALREGICDRDAICDFVSLQPEVQEAHPNKSTLRATIVTTLGKEKNSKVPLFEQEDTTYPLTREGRLALGRAEDDDLDDWKTAGLASSPGGKRDDWKTASSASSPGGKRRGGANSGRARVEAPETSPSGEASSAPLLVPPPPPPAHWQFPIKGERIEVEVSLGDTTAWVTAEVLTILFDGTFQARIELPDLSDRWEDWFTWQEEGTEWRRREEWKSRPPPKKWKWLNEGDRVEVEIRVGEGDEAAGAWVTAEVLTVLIDGTFQARIELPDGSDQWEDWFSWQEEGTEWRREKTDKKRKTEKKRKPPPDDWVWLLEGEKIEVEVAAGEDAPPAWVKAKVLAVLIDGTFQARIELPDGSDQWEDWFSWQEEGKDWRRRTLDAWQLHLEAREAYQRPANPSELFSSLAARISELKRALEDDADEVDGWYLCFKLRKKTAQGARQGDINVIDPLDGESFHSLIAIRRKLGLAAEEEGGEGVPSPSKHDAPQGSSGEAVRVLHGAPLEMPPGWVGVRHAAPSGTYTTYEGPGGKKARSLREAWREHEGLPPPAKRSREEADADRETTVAQSAPVEELPPAVASSNSPARKVPKRDKWPSKPLGYPSLQPGEALVPGVMAEAIMHEEGLEGSRFVVDVLELRGKGAKREAYVQYHALFDEFPVGSDETDETSLEEPPLLREWVSATVLRPPPPPPPPGWHRNLKTGDAAEAQHEGGWWQVTVQSRLPGNARLQEPPRFVIEATGYGVRRTVEMHTLRPPSDKVQSVD